jgi:Asp-tRNA(Asn)/Glu-tRNA(Gln) amidotransferase C subunit
MNNQRLAELAGIALTESSVDQTDINAITDLAADADKVINQIQRAIRKIRTHTDVKSMEALVSALEAIVDSVPDYD